MKFYVEDLDEETRREDARMAFTRGNHKLAGKYNEFLAKAIKKAIMREWNLILPGDCHEHIPEIVLNSMDVATHVGVTESGHFEWKHRMTHDLSLPGGSSGESVNSRVNKASLKPCMFSFVFSRIIHYIVALRNEYLHTKIWIRKEDIKSAFRRLHLDASTAFKSAVRVQIEGNWYIIISLRHLEAPLVSQNLQ